MLDSDPRFSTSLLKDIFVTALEEGSDYWLIIDNWCLEDHVATITDIEDTLLTKHQINLVTIKHGLELLYSNSKNSELSRKKISNILNQNYDVEDTDIILQYGLFGELRYG